MSQRLASLLAAFEELWPIAGAEAWDAPGLVTGSADQPVSRVLLTVDVTKAVLEEAVDGGFDLILAHHPYIMRGVSSLSEQTQKGALLSEAIRRGVAIYAAHTNADIVENGVSAVLAARLGVSSALPLLPSPTNPAVGHGRIGRLESPMRLADFAGQIATSLPSTVGGVRVAGDREQLIQTVALCAGAGDSFIAAAVAQGADAYITSDLRHHVVQDAREQAVITGGTPALIDISHWAAEWLWLEQAASQITGIFEGIQVVVSQLRTDPWDFHIPN